MSGSSQRARASAQAKPVKDMERAISVHPFFKGMPKPQLRAIAQCASPVSFEAGRYVFREGDPADRFYAIQEGVVVIQITEPGSAGVSIQRVGSGEVLGWSWLVTPHRKRFDAKVLEPVRAVAFDAKLLRAKCGRDLRLGNEMMRRMIQVVGNRLQAVRLQVLDAYNIPR